MMDEFPKKVKPFTRREVKNLFQVSYPTLNDWKKKGILIPFKLGRKVFYSCDEVNRVISDSEVNSHAG